MQTLTFELPAHWACALINGDLSGYTDAEVKEITLWLQANGNPNIVDMVGEPFFGRFNGLMGELAEYTALAQ